MPKERNESGMKENNIFSENTKLEVALEILAAKIAKTSKDGFGINDKEMLDLLDERKKMYSGDMDVIEKIIKVYGPEIKNDYKEA